jgi:PKD-like domain
MKRFVSFILVLLCFAGNAQVLKTTNLNLSTNGRIYDIAYIPNVNSYAVVGEFTSINGTPRKNLAFINATTFTVQSSNPITTIDGAIRSIEYTTINNGTLHNYIVLGGEFNTINSLPRESMALLYSTGSSVFTGLSFLNWNYFMQAGGGNFDNGVFDLNISGDTLLVAGQFEGLNLSSASPTVCNVVEDNLLALKFTPSVTNPHPHLAILNSAPQSFNSLDVGVVSMMQASNNYFIGSQDFPINNGGVNPSIQRRNTNLSLNGTFTASVGNRHGFHSLAQLNDTLLLATDGGIDGSGSLASNMIICKLFGNAPSGNSQYAINPLLTGFATNVWGQTGYNGDLFMYKGTTPTLQRHSVNSALVTNALNFTQIGTSIPVTSSGSHIDTNNNLILANNYLFLSEKGMTNAGGQVRTGLAVFCLEPQNPSPFVNPTLSVCPNETVIYTIADVNFETGYKWTYSGTGVEYSINNGAFVPYTVAVMNTTANASSIKLRFPLGSTSGTLSVEPYNTCNTTSDYLYAKPQSVAITVNPLPAISLPFDTLSFTCVVDTLNLVTESSTAGVNFQWAYPNTVTPVSTNDTLTIFGTGVQPSIIYPTGTYYATVTNPMTGCQNNDSIFVMENTTPPTISQDSLTISAPYFTCAITQINLSASVAGCSTYWTTASDTTVQFANPLTINSANLTDSNFYAFAVSITNGCIARTGFDAQFDNTLITGILSNYSNFPAELITDTINCTTTAISIDCAVDSFDPNAGNGTAYWVQNNTTNLSLSTADSAGMFLNTNTYQFVTENALNGCRDTNDVVIYFDLNVPFVAPFTGLSSINCSVDTLTLIHPQTGGQVQESWIDNLGTPTGSNSLFVDAVGDYIYQVVALSSGCTSYDTVTVDLTQEMYLTSNDTVVCPALLFSVQTTPVNISESVSYLWSTGETTQSGTGIGGTDTQLTVVATSQSGCVGHDTINISITPPIQATISAFMGCGESNGSLQITNVTGGAGTYQYSIDGTTYNGNLLFDSLSEGDYTIFVKDALGCVYDFDQTLDASASAPSMSFLVSTYSQLGDTLAVVNNTLYQGFDSTGWVFPIGTIVFYESDSMALIQLPQDSNCVSISLVGYQDTCSYLLTKTIYTDSVAPDYPTSYNSVKIQSLDVYPNPTIGDFNVDVVFGIDQNFFIIVTNELGQPVGAMTDSGFASPTLSLMLNFPQGTPPGTYHLHVISDYDAQQVTLILN